MTSATHATTDLRTPRFSRILGIGSYRPRRRVDNAEIAGRTGLTEKWIVQRSGIHFRNYAEPDETLAFMATSAAEKAMAAAGVTAAEVDCVVVATITHLTQTPALAVEVAHRLGTGTAAFDISAACAGFSHGIELASGMVKQGSMSRVLVIGVERMTDILDHHDRDTAFLFADGAGAAVVGPADEPGIGPVSWLADGSRQTALGMSANWERYLLEQPEDWPVISMSGWRVYRWATENLVPAIHQILANSGVTVDQLGAFVPHQANMLITDHLVQEINFPEHVAIARDIAEAGNSSAASIPMALDQLIQRGEVASGDLALLLGFGAGLVYAGQVVRLP